MSHDVQIPVKYDIEGIEVTKLRQGLSLRPC